MVDIGLVLVALEGILLLVGGGVGGMGMWLGAIVGVWV